MKDKIIREKLYERVKQEYNNYILNLKSKTLYEVIDSSYETTIKEQILDFFYPNIRACSIEQIKTLNKCKNILEELYQSWMNSDGGINSIIEDSIYNTLDRLDRKEKRARRQEEYKLLR